MQNHSISTKKIVLIFSLTVGLVLLVTAIIYVATHGILKVSNPGSEGYRLILENTQDSESDTSTKKWQIIPSGTYIAEFNNNGMMQQKRVVIPSWLQSVASEFSDTSPQKVTQIASGTLGDITRDSLGNVISFSTTGDSTSTAFIHKLDDPSGTRVDFRTITPSFSFGVVSNGKLVGFQNDTEIPYPLLYGPSFTEQVATLNSATTENIPNIIPTSSVGDEHIGLSYPIENAYINVYEASRFVKRISVDNGFAKTTNGLMIASMSGDYVAVGYGNNSTEIEGDENENEDVSAEQQNKEFIIKIYKLSRDTTKELNLGKGVSINSLSISKDGTRLAVEKNGRLEVYNLQTSEHLFTYFGSAIKTPVWKGNKTLIFNDQLSGLLSYNDQSRVVSTLFQSGILTINTFTVTDNSVLFTATRTSDSGEVRAEFNGYELSLNTKAADNNKLLQALPYQNSSITIRSLNNVIYASPNKVVRPPANTEGAGFYRGEVDEDIKQQVTSYLQKNIPNYTSFEIVYGFNL